MRDHFPKKIMRGGQHLGVAVVAGEDARGDVGVEPDAGGEHLLAAGDADRGLAFEPDGERRSGDVVERDAGLDGHLGEGGRFGHQPALPLSRPWPSSQAIASSSEYATPVMTAHASSSPSTFHCSSEGRSFFVRLSSRAKVCG